MSLNPETGGENSPTPEQIETAAQAKTAADEQAAVDADALRVQKKVDDDLAKDKPTIATAKKTVKPAAGKLPPPTEPEPDDEESTMHRIGNKFTIAGLALAIIGIAIRNIL